MALTDPPAPGLLPAPITAVLNGLFALLLSYMFMVVLMTASAQQRVTAVLGDLKDAERIDYSSALARVKDAERSQAELLQILLRQKGLIDQEQLARAKLTDAEVAIDEAWNRFWPIGERIMKVEDCGPASKPDGAIAWNWVLACRKSVVLPERLKRELDEVVSTTPNFSQADRDLQAARRNAAAATTALKAVQDEAAQTAKAVSEAQALRTAFGEMNVLRSSWLLAGGILAEFPPTMMQIILAAFAGAFGALIITLVLAVYPRTQFSFTSSGGYFARILLGGLISLCVYIILSGGTAILGTADPFNGAQANVMTFSAVGLLAGMFSDRVAHWLSDKADTFFARNGDSGGAGGAGPGGEGQR